MCCGRRRSSLSIFVSLKYAREYILTWDTKKQHHQPPYTTRHHSTVQKTFLSSSQLLYDVNVYLLPTLWFSHKCWLLVRSPIPDADNLRPTIDAVKMTCEGRNQRAQFPPAARCDATPSSKGKSSALIETVAWWRSALHVTYVHQCRPLHMYRNISDLQKRYKSVF